MGTVSQWINQFVKSINRKHITRGQSAERKAEKYLLGQGLKLLARNYQTKAGEIDLIMSDQGDWVFIEVRYKESSDWASSAESVTWQKQRKVIKAAKYYLSQYDVLGHQACRFDVIAMSGALKTPKIEWLKHAFY